MKKFINIFCLREFDSKREFAFKHASLIFEFYLNLIEKNVFNLAKDEFILYIEELFPIASFFQNNTQTAAISIARELNVMFYSDMRMDLYKPQLSLRSNVLTIHTNSAREIIANFCSNPLNWITNFDCSDLPSFASDNDQKNINVNFTKNEMNILLDIYYYFSQIAIAPTLIKELLQAFALHYETKNVNHLQSCSVIYHDLDMRYLNTQSDNLKYDDIFENVELAIVPIDTDGMQNFDVFWALNKAITHVQSKKPSSIKNRSYTPSQIQFPIFLRIFYGILLTPTVFSILGLEYLTNNSIFQKNPAFKFKLLSLSNLICKNPGYRTSCLNHQCFGFANTDQEVKLTIYSLHNGYRIVSPFCDATCYLMYIFPRGTQPPFPRLLAEKRSKMLSTLFMTQYIFHFKEFYNQEDSYSNSMIPKQSFSSIEPFVKIDMDRYKELKCDPPTSEVWDTYFVWYSEQLKLRKIMRQTWFQIPVLSEDVMNIIIQCYPFMNRVFIETKKLREFAVETKIAS